MNSPTPICECGSDEFVTKPNAYDVYKVINGAVSFSTQEYVDETTLLYCRNCGREHGLGILSRDLITG